MPRSISSPSVRSRPGDSRTLPSMTSKALPSAAAVRSWNAWICPTASQFYTWCSGERERARGLHVALLKTLIARLRDPLSGRSFTHGRCWRSTPSPSPLISRSFACWPTLGKTRDALEGYDRCRRILEEQIGARPSAELEQLRASLRRPSRAAPARRNQTLPMHGGVGARRGRAAPLGAGGPQARAGAPREIPARPGTGAGTFHALLLAGDSGMGKTRLLEELGRMVLEGGGRVLQGRAFEGEGSSTRTAPGSTRSTPSRERESPTIFEPISPCSSRSWALRHSMRTGPGSSMRSCSFCEDSRPQLLRSW